MALRAALWVHAAGAAVFLWLQPRGFSFGSRSFVEHQVLAPLFFLVSLAAALCPEGRPRWRIALVAGLAGFWAVCAGVFAALGSTVFARGLWPILAGALGLAALLARFPERRRQALLGAGMGGVVGGLFLHCAWAPPATTRPRAFQERIRDASPPKVRVEGRYLTLEREGRRLTLDPSFRFGASSPSGSWTLFDHRSIQLPAWEVRRSESEETVFGAIADGLKAWGQVWVEGDEVHVRIRTTLEREVAAHLASVFTIIGATPARVQEVDWPDDEPAAFIAFRRGHLELLRASSREKGPFETLASLPQEDPIIEAGGWSIQVRGWAEQASKAESPTAGWGVSQGAIENWGGTLSWSLAATSIGRGWHSVRTAAGTYTLEAVLR